MAEAEATFLFLKVRGTEAVEKAGEVLAKLIGSMGPEIPVAADNGTDVAVELAEPVKRIEAKPPRKYKPRYKKPADEPDGFGTAPPKLNGHRADGALASEIIGCVNLEGPMSVRAIASKLERSEGGVKMAVTKSANLKTLADGRVALANHDESDD